jgi:hypothetical protein
MHRISCLLSVCFALSFSLKAQLLPFVANHQRGLLNIHGQVVLKAHYDDHSLGPDQGFFYLKQGRKTGLFHPHRGLLDHRTNRRLCTPKLIAALTEDLRESNTMRVIEVAKIAIRGDSRKDLVWGLIDPLGDPLYPPVFQEIDIDPEGYYYLKQQDTSHYLDPYGIPLGMPGLDQGQKFKNGLALLKFSHAMGLMDRNGNFVLSSPADQIYPIEGEFFVEETRGLFGLVNRKGEIALPPEYAEISAIEGNSVLKLVREGRYTYLHANGSWLFD